jgi:hypothetical protein
MQNVTAGRSRNLQLTITRALQVVRHIHFANGITGVDPQRSSINPGCGLLNMSGKTKVNHPAVGNPVVRPEAGRDNKQKNCNPKKDQTKPGSPISPANSNTQGSSPIRREKKR